MVKHGDVILLDTTAIIEAHKHRCWNAIANFFRLETVEKCIEECGTGDTKRRDKVPIDVPGLRKEVIVHRVEKSALISAAPESPLFSTIDFGEQEVLAFAFTGYQTSDVWYISSQDRGCIRAGHELGLLERFISYEKMTRSVGLDLSVKHNFTDAWLRDIRTTIKLEQL